MYMKHILLPLLGALIILGGAYYYFTMRDAVETVEEQPEAVPDIGDVTSTGDMPDGSVSGMRVEENAVVAMEQRPGSTVRVAQVYMSAPGYVVIHEDADGAPGAILGASALLAGGETSGIVVTLSRPTIEGEKLWSMLHTEARGNTTFEVASDVPVMSRSGEALSGWFEINANADENVDVTM